MHRSRVSQLVGLGLPVLPNGKIHRSEAVAWVKSHVRPRGKAPLASDKVGPGPRERLDDLKVARARLALDKEAGRLVDRAKAEAAIFERARFERDAHLAFCQRLAPILAGELGADPAVVHAILDREMRQHLVDLAKTPLPGLSDARRS